MQISTEFINFDSRPNGKTKTKSNTTYMRKTTLSCLILFLLLFSKLKAQPDTSTTQKLLQYIFQNIDKTQVPTGFLEEFGCPMLPMATFNGTLTDSNRIDMNLLRTLYFQLQTGYVGGGSNPLPAITTVNTAIRDKAYDTLPVPIPLVLSYYNTVKSNAFTSNLLSYNSGTRQIADVPGRPQSPYETKTLFAACPNKKQSTTGSESFVIPSSLVWNNTGKTISQVQIDFDDDNGFQTVTIGTPIAVNYDETGNKRWTIKVTLSDASVLQCYNDYYALAASSGSARYVPFGVVPAWGFVFPSAGVHSGATVRVVYSSLTPTNTLRKPLIVVEGYDVSNIAPSMQDNYAIRDFINSLDEPAASGYDFNEQLDEIAGYDLVFIDFWDGADDIVRNAAIVQEVINRVNNNKMIDNRFGGIVQQNVVMGLSMGGLCARYALANMTKNFPGTPTQTKLLITHDSPHRGANVPLGLQYMIRMMGGFQLFGTNVYNIYPEYDEAISLLNAPATQQLLLYRSTSPNTFVTNTFLNTTYRNMITFQPSDPQPVYRFVATANGNECAHPLFNPGKTFVNLGAGISAGIEARFLFFRVPIVTYRLSAAVEAYALPNTGSTAKIARLETINSLKLFGFIDIIKQIYVNTAFAPGSHMPVDGVPGSNYPLLDVQALNQLTQLPTFALNLYVSFPLGPFLGGYFGAWAYNQGVSYLFTFVPVASALDVTPYVSQAFSQEYVNGSNELYPSTSETFIAQETVSGNPSATNNVHVRFTPRNSRFLYKEMELQNNFENCSNECSNPYYITGSGIICTNGVYSIPGLQRGAAISWTATPANIVQIASSGNSATLTKLANGIITLTATITACGPQQVVSKNFITVGTPAPNQFYFEGGYISGGSTITPQSAPNHCIEGIGSEWEVTIQDVDLNATYNWVIDNGDPRFGQGTGYIGFFGAGDTYPDVYISVQAQNTCGMANFVWFYVPYCPFLQNNYKISPNPASDAIIIDKMENPEFRVPQPQKENENIGISEVRIYNLSRMLVRQTKTGNARGPLRVNVAGLKSGWYIVEVITAQKKEVHKIFVK